MKNSRNILSLIIVLLIMLLGVAAYGIKNYSAMDLSLLNKEGQQKLESLIKDYIISHPEVILDSMANLRGQKENTIMQDARSNLKDKRNIIEQVSNNPVSGTQDADITITEFYDYRCGFCKKSSNMLSRLIADDEKIKVIYKEFPILGGNSTKLARLALAVHITDPTKFVLFHNKLMESDDQNETRVRSILKDMNINYEQIINKSKDNLITEILDNNRNLAREANISAVPSMIINGELINDPYDINNVRNIIERIRNSR